MAEQPARARPGLRRPLRRVYQLYYFFPLTAEQTSLAQTQRTLLLVGVAVVFLLAAIAWLVTRWVVIPVRLAAHGALRLSTGHLDERMAGPRLRRAGRAGHVVQPDGRQPPGEAARAGGPVPGAAPVRLGRLARAAHAADDDQDRRRRAVRGQGRAGCRPPARSAELLQSQLERFESLLTDLLEISRYDANAATLDAEPVDVCDIARQSADVAQQLAERRGTKIEFRLPAEPCIAEVDRRRVERILRNLLVNAVEHGENREAVVTVAADSGAVAVSVRDFGVGLCAGRGAAGLRPVLAGRPGPGPDHGRDRPGPVHRPGGRAAARRLAGGLGRARPRLGVPADAAARRSASELAGSPLPLGPGPGDVDAEVVGLTTTIVPLNGPGLGNGAGPGARPGPARPPGPADGAARSHDEPAGPGPTARSPPVARLPAARRPSPGRLGRGGCWPAAAPRSRPSAGPRRSPARSARGQPYRAAGPARAPGQLERAGHRAGLHGRQRELRRPPRRRPCVPRALRLRRTWQPGWAAAIVVGLTPKVSGQARRARAT